MSSETPKREWSSVAQGGVLGLIVFFLLGMVPGTKSPFDTLKAEISAEIRSQSEQVEEQLRNNRQTQEKIYRALRAICYRLPNHPAAPSCEQ